MRVGTIKGTQLILNNAFILIMILFALVGLLQKALIVFGVVLIHELAHVFTAIGYGLRVREIELLPFGGVARIEGMSNISSGVELRIAAAGPLVNFILAGATWAAAACFSMQWEQQSFFLETNIALGLFNLLPALPLDGGRIYRASLTRLIGYRQATERAANIGRVTALCLAAACLWSLYYGIVNFTLVFLAVFLYCAATKERNMASYVCMQQLTRKKEDLLLRGVLPTEQFTAVATTPLRDIVRWFEPQKYHAVYVVNEDCTPCCLLTEAEILEGLLANGMDAPVGELARKQE